jgi:ribokinase
MQPFLLVVGSTNTDMVIKTEHLPAPGETILGGNFFMNAGGKGANQAVAARRLGANVIFIAKTGNDIFGKQSLQSFNEEGINTEYMCIDPDNPSGVALINIDNKGENCIAVASGANSTLSVDDLKDAETVIKTASFILMQLEIPLATVEYMAALAKSHGTKTILNPAPACKLPAELFRNIYIITPNKKEAEMLSGITINDKRSVKEAARVIKAKGVDTVIITLGAEGAFLYNDVSEEMVAAPEVTAVDTTAAGDVFNGALAVALSENASIKDAVKFACHAAALSVTKFGAQASAPKRNAVDLFFDLQKEKIHVV